MGVFSFIGDLVNDILGGNSARRDSQGYNLENMAIQQQYGEKNMAIQNKYNVEAFNSENAYNSPLAQRQRMEQAGLNPNWDGPGSVVAQQDSGVAATAPSGGMPSGSNDGSALGFLAQMLSLNQELKVKQSEVKKNEAETQNILGMLPYNQENVRANTKSALAKAGVDEKTAEYYLSDLEHKWKNLGFQNLSLLEAIKRIEELLPHEKEKMSAETYNILMSGALNKVLAECKPKEVAIAQQEANTHSAAQKEEARHNLQEEKTAVYNAVTARLGHYEQVRTNKVHEAIDHYNSYTQRLLATASANKMSAETIAQNMANELQHELIEAGVPQSTAAAQKRYIEQQIYNLQQEYNMSKPKESFSDWLNIQLMSHPEEMNGLYLWRSIPFTEDPLK